MDPNLLWFSGVKIIKIVFVMQRLVKLKTDGTELVTNVEVAADAREAMRRLEEEEARRLR